MEKRLLWFLLMAVLLAWFDRFGISQIPPPAPSPIQFVQCVNGGPGANCVWASLWNAATSKWAKPNWYYMVLPAAPPPTLTGLLPCTLANFPAGTVVLTINGQCGAPTIMQPDGTLAKFREGTFPPGPCPVNVCDVRHDGSMDELVVKGSPAFTAGLSSFQCDAYRLPMPCIYRVESQLDGKLFVPLGVRIAR